MSIIDIFNKQKLFFSSNVTKDYNFRIMMLRNLRMAIENHEGEIIKALGKDLNKSEFEAYATEIGIIYEEIDFAINNLKEWIKPVKVKTTIVHKPSKSYYIWEPRGVAFIMAPWNYPFQLVMAPLVGSIAAGNTSIIKPSEQTLNTANIIEKIINNSFKEEYLYVLRGGRDMSSILMDQPLDYIFFTGSSEIGKFVMSKAAQNLVPVTLELGGKSPCIVHEDCDMDITAKRIVWGKLLNCGQTCVAPDYILVHKNIKEEFLGRIMAYIDKFYSKNNKENSDLPRIINEKHFRRLMELIEGHEVIYGGHNDERTRFIEPTILDNVSWDDKAMEDEIFGPIFPIIEYEEIDDVIRNIKKKASPLALYLFTEDKDLTQKVLYEVPFGGGCINDTVSHVANPNLPFGGVGMSGMGSYHGQKSFEIFSNHKGIMDKNTKFDLKLKYPPHNKKKLSLLRKVFK